MFTGRLLFYSIVSRFLPETRFWGLKRFILRWCGAIIGENVRIASSAKIIGCGELVIGDDVWIGPSVFLYPSMESAIYIGNGVDVAPCVKIVTGSHYVDPDGVHIAGKGYRKSVRIGNGCWLGCSSIILPGVEISDKVVVAAGAVVSASIKNNCVLVAGVPANIKKQYG